MKIELSPEMVFSNDINAASFIKTIGDNILLSVRNKTVGEDQFHRWFGR
jgi:hypothetical protein